MAQAKGKSLKINMVLNGIKGLMSVLFPLISFPYISKILQVDNVGRYNFANSIISYFVLLAGLGISTYAIREGARIRHNKHEFQTFANEIFSINVVSTIASYILLIVCIILVPKFYVYKSLLIILSLQVIFKTIGIEWIYSIYEDYAYITIRSIAFQIISLALMFLLIRTPSDVNMYALITVISSVGSNVLNYFHAKHYCKVHITKNMNWKNHIKPILILFAMSVTIMIYVSSDITLLGFIKNDYNVGLYSVSVKVYTIVKTILSSVLVVSIPRLSMLLGKGKKAEFNSVAADIYKTLLSVLLPAIVGIILLRKEIVLIISDSTYIEATTSLLLLSIAMFFSMGAWFWGQCILVPLKKERIVFKATIASAVLNIVLNFVLIPIWAENAAAFTTILAEGLAYFWCMIEGRKYTSIDSMLRISLKIICGCIGIVVVARVLSLFNMGMLIYTIALIVISVICYTIIEIALKNEAQYGILKKLINKIHKSSKS
jgi:O-antigen/teichoic acid export membrane protein